MSTRYEIPLHKDGVLLRNRACHQCRKRKLKCDARKPHCSVCTRGHRGSEPINCTWDEVKIPRRTLQAMKRAERERQESKRRDEGREDDCAVEPKRQRIDELQGRLETVEASCKWTESSLQEAFALPSLTPLDHSPELLLSPLDSLGSLVPSIESSPALVGSSHAAVAPLAQVMPGSLLFWPKPRGSQESIFEVDSALTSDACCRTESALPWSCPPQESAQRAGVDDGEFIPVAWPDSSKIPPVLFDLNAELCWPTPPPTVTVSPMQGSSSLMDFYSPLTQPRGLVTPASWSPLNYEAAMMAPTADCTLVGAATAERSAVWASLSNEAPPGWPPSLPAARFVSHFADVFFSCVHPYSAMIHKAQLYQRLSLPPTHPQFPPKVLLHAIVATASRYTSGEAVGTDDATLFAFAGLTACANGSASSCSVTLPTCSFYPHNWVAPLEQRNFAHWHFGKAAEDIRANVTESKHLIETAQARVLLTLSHFHNAAWSQAQSDSVRCMDMCSALGLNVSPYVNSVILCGLQSLQTADDSVGHEERVRTYWMSFMLNRMVGVCTASSSTVADDATGELPITQDLFEAVSASSGSVAEPRQTLLEVDFHLEHPSHHADSLNLLIKAVYLCSQASKLRAQGRERSSQKSWASDPEVQLLLQQVTTFRLGFPSPLRKPLGANQGDSNLLTVAFMCHLVTLIVCELHINAGTWQTDLANRAIVSLRSILSLVHDLIRTDYDLSYLNHMCPQVWFTAARVTLRFAVAARLSGDAVSADVFRSEADTYRLACQAYGERSATGLRQAAMITDMTKLSTYATLKHFVHATGTVAAARDESARSSKGQCESGGVFLGSTIDLSLFLQDPEQVIGANFDCVNTVA